MATGMERMMASMLGVTPEQMQETIQNAVALLANINERFEVIERKQDEILAELKGKENAEETGPVAGNGETNSEKV